MVLSQGHTELVILISLLLQLYSSLIDDSVLLLIACHLEILEPLLLQMLHSRQKFGRIGYFYLLVHLS